jgi:hypothetical protein
MIWHNVSGADGDSNDGSFEFTGGQDAGPMTKLLPSRYCRAGSDDRAG